jgi:MATE family multidrug resistance protein
MPQSKNLHRQIWFLAWPMILANVATTLIGIVDTAILGHLPDPIFIGGAAVATSLFNIIYMSLAFLRMGTTGLVAQHYGEKNWQDLHNTLLLSSAIAISIGGLLIVFRSFVFNFSIPLIGGSDKVQDMAFVYANIRVLSSPFVLFNFVTLGFLIGIQKSQQALLLLMFSQAINILLDFYLAIHLSWDIVGVAWATVISDICGSILAVYFIFRYLKPHISSWFYLSDILVKLNRVFSLNKDIFFRTVVLISIFAFITAQSARQGDVILAANSILIQLFFFMANAVDGFANAAESRTGQIIGEHKRFKNDFVGLHIQESYRIALLQGGIFLSVSLVLIILFSKNLLLSISNLPSILESTQTYFLWLPVVMVCSLVCFILDGVLIGATKGRLMLGIIFSSTLLVFFPAWFFLQAFENHGIWLALCLFMVFRSGLTYFLCERNSKGDGWV